MEIQEEIKDLLEKAEWAPKYSVEKSDILHRALKLAESCNDETNLLKIRQEYVECLVFQGRHEQAFPHFGLNLARLDRGDETLGWYGRISILWSYKWFMGAMTDFTNLSRAQIFHALEDMERRFLAENVSNQRAIYDYKRRIHFAMGDLEEASHYDQLHQESKGARLFFGLEDCAACVANIEVKHLFWRGQFSDALSHAQPILDGTLKCESIPRSTYPAIILCYSLLGKNSEADDLFKKSLKLLKKENHELQNFGLLICYAARSNKFRQGITLFQNQVKASLESMNKHDLYHFYQAVNMLFEHIKGSGKKNVKLQIPENDHLYSSDDNYNLDDLIRFYSGQIRAIANAFDTRNGNDHYSNRLNTLYNRIRSLEVVVA